MKNSEYLKLPQGLYGRYRWRRRRGWTHYSFKEEPKSKKSMSKIQSIEFREKLSRRTKIANRKAYRAPIISEMSFTTTDKNPPHIHTIVKNYQDLLEGLIYQNDRQIYGLSVRYHIGSEPEMTFSFAPFRYFLQDLELASDIIYGEYSDYIRCDDFDKILDEIQGHRQSENNNSLKEYNEILKDKNKLIRVVGKKIYNEMLLFQKVLAQEQLLKNLNISISELNSFYIPLIFRLQFGRNLSNSEKDLDDTLEVTSQAVVNSPKRINLPNAPVKKGDTDIFKREIRKSLTAFHQIHPIFKPLHIPVNLNILFKPPKESKEDRYDLDNIMKKIVPAFNEIFIPPSTHVSHIVLENIKDERLYRALEEMQNKIPKSIRTSISGYDIFRMPRETNDESEGYLSLSFSSGTSHQSSPISIIDYIIDSWIKYVDH